ncbi:MAG: hypothetical protein NTX53_20810 [candidate division WOR-3 bacterium]|nr:hypothetical protein [candidate division WOR-3 bacterium]
MSDVTRRIDRWKAKYSPELAKATCDRIYEDMVRRYEDSVVALCETEAKTRQVLNALGISTCMYVPYLSYARELFKLARQRGITGTSFAMAAKVLADKWQARDLDPVALETILKQVFGSADPGP